MGHAVDGRDLGEPLHRASPGGEAAGSSDHLLGTPLPAVSVASLVTAPDPLLSAVSAPVTRFDAELARLAGDMYSVMLLLRGVGLAGVQVGVPLRLFTFRAEGSAGTAVNPVILERRGEYRPEEGCLSLPGRFYEPRRHREVLAEWQEVDGTPCRAWVSGLLAEIFEHELDHLDGRLLNRLPEVPGPVSR